MKAALYTKPNSLNVVSKDLRRLKPTEVLVKVEACGICGTDIHIVAGQSRSTPPVVLGHEYAGVIQEVGKNVRDLILGDRVAVDPNISCGRCFHCTRGEVHLCTNLLALGVDIDGGMAEYSIVPETQIYKVPSTLSMQNSAFIEPVSCVIHGVDKTRLQAGASVVIMGAGTIGLLMLQLVKSTGASQIGIIEPNAQKRALALKMGADFAFSPSEAPDGVRNMSEPGADVVIECVGKPQTMKEAIALARRGGTVEFFGVCPVGETISIEPNEIYFRELTIVGSYINPHTFTRAVDALSSGAVGTNELEVSNFPLEGVHEALAALREGKTTKSIIQPWL